MFSVCNTWVIYRCMMQLVGSIMQYLNYTLLTDFVILKNETHFILDFTDLVMKLLCLSVVSLPTTPSPPTPSFPTTKHTYTPKIPTYISIPQHFLSPPPPHTHLHTQQDPNQHLHPPVFPFTYSHPHISAALTPYILSNTLTCAHFTRPHVPLPKTTPVPFLQSLSTPHTNTSTD